LRQAYLGVYNYGPEGKAIFFDHQKPTYRRLIYFWRRTNEIRPISSFHISRARSVQNKRIWFPFL